MLNPLTRDDYNKVVEEFSDMIFRIAYQNLCNIADAEDVVQEVFISLLKSKGKIFKDSEHLKSWLIRVTINKCLDVRRSFFRKNTVPIESQVISYTDEEKILMDEIMKLPKDYRNIIYLYYYEGYKIKEIAEILGKNQNTISSKLQRGRNKLKENLIEGGYYNERNLQECTW